MSGPSTYVPKSAAAKWLETRLPILGLVHSSVSFAPLYGIKGASFDPRQMNWIGNIDVAPALCVAWHGAGVRTWQDLFDKPYIVGTSGCKRFQI